MNHDRPTRLTSERSARFSAVFAHAVLFSVSSACVLAQNTCLPAIDSDGDRLRDCFETQLGTDPSNPDTDGDSLNDGDEVLNPTNGINITQFVAGPLVKDILIEFDYVYDPSLSESPSKRAPHPFFLQTVSETFGRLPFYRGEERFGVRVSVDWNVGGNPVAIPGGLWGQGSNAWQSFQSVKSTNFDPKRTGYFHYALAVESSTSATVAGLAEILGDDFFFGYTAPEGHPTTSQDVLEKQSAGLFVHELGHNLGLYHGGGDTCNFKPNYPSVMNYRYSGGIDGAKAGPCSIEDWVGGAVETLRIQFSYGSYPPLDENAITERSGLCSEGFEYMNIAVNPPGHISSAPVSENLTTECEAIPLRILYDYPDHLLMNFGGIIPPGKGDSTPQVVE